MNTINTLDQPAATGLVPNAITKTDVGTTLTPQQQNTSTDPMHRAGWLRDRGMSRSLHATPPEDRAAIAAALLRGFDHQESRRAEDALQAANFVWPKTATPRVLGAIVSHLARIGLIKEEGWTKGRMGRSHFGRVSLWRKVLP